MIPDDLPLIAQCYRLSQPTTRPCAAPAGRCRQRPADPRRARRGGGSPSRPAARLLRALAAEGLSTEDEQGRFGPTPTSERLTGESEDSLMVLGWRVLPATYGAFGHLLDAVRTGAVAFQIAHGRSFYEHLSHDPAAARAYDAATGRRSRPSSRCRSCTTAVTIARPSTILRRDEQLRGVLDRPDAVAQVAEGIARLGLGDRIDVVAMSDAR